jgi:hypothetical protein
MTKSIPDTVTPPSPSTVAAVRLVGRWAEAICVAYDQGKLASDEVDKFAEVSASLSKNLKAQAKLLEQLQIAVDQRRLPV